MNIRSSIYKEVQSRLNNGQRKEQIYSELKGKYPAAAVERSLAQWPYPEAKAKNLYLNVPLLIIIAVFAIVKTLQFVAIFQSSESGAALAVIPFAVLTLLIYAYILYGVLNCNLIGYMLALLMSAATLLSSRHGMAGGALPLALSAAAFVLAWLQKSRLFPHTSWLLRHKKDADGNIIF